MKTNDIKKGTRIRLRNGWYATMWDNKKGNIRVADVEGICHEAGSVYSHDILWVRTQGESKTVEENPGAWVFVEHTPEQLKLRKQVNALGM